jgi:hypothetical protein
MKRLSLILALASLPAFAQAPVPPVSDAPPLTLDEKIALTTDDVKKSDVLEKLQKQYLEMLKPLQDHQDSVKSVIEKEHPGWVLENGPMGWRLTKKTEAAKPAETPKK